MRSLLSPNGQGARLVNSDLLTRKKSDMLITIPPFVTPASVPVSSKRTDVSSQTGLASFAHRMIVVTAK